MNARSKLIFITRVVLWGLAAAIFYSAMMSFISGWYYPNNTFLFNPVCKFSDFFDPLRAMKNGFAPYSNPNFLMPHFPFAMFIEYLFTFIPRDLSFLLFSTIFVTYYLFSAYYFLKGHVERRYLKWHLPALLLLSYPFLFLIDRANFEALVYVFISLFVYFQYIDRRPNLALILLASAIAMKLFPAIFLLLFIADRDYKGLIKTVVLTVVLTLATLAAAMGGMAENWVLFNASLSKYFELYALGTSKHCFGLAFGHSLFGVLRLFFAVFHPETYTASIKGILPFYNVFVAAYALVISAYVVLVEKILWKRIAILVFTFNLLPYVSADYKLIHLLVPVLLFIKAPDTGNSKLYCLLFGLLLVPKAFYRFPGIISDSGFSDITLSIVLNPVLMLAASALIVTQGISAWHKGASEAAV